MLPYLWMLLGAFSFAIMGTLTHALGESCDWQVVALVRSLLSFVFAATLAVAAGKRLVFLRPYTLWIRSLAGTLSLLCTFFALTHFPVADVLTLTNMFPIWVALLSWPLFGERPPGEVWIAIIIGVCGVALIQQPHLAAGDVAVFAALVSSFASAVALMGLHRLHDVDPRAVVAHFSGVSTVVCLVILLFFADRQVPIGSMNSETWGMLFGVGASATIGQLLLTLAFAAGPPAKISVVALSQVGFAVAMDILIWHRSFNRITIIGIALVVAPTAWLLTRQKA